MSNGLEGMSAVDLDEASGAYGSRPSKHRLGVKTRPLRTSKITNEFFDDLRAGLLEELVERRGIDRSLAETQCAEIGRAVWRALAWSSRVYFPTGLSVDVETRKKAIVAEFTGNNTAALARKHKTTFVNVYRVLSDDRKSRRRGGAAPTQREEDRPGMELLSLFSSTIAEALCKQGYPKGAAEEIGIFARDWMRRIWGGASFFVGLSMRGPEWMHTVVKNESEGGSTNMPAGGVSTSVESKALEGLKESMQRALGGDPGTAIDAWRTCAAGGATPKEIDASAIERAIHEAQ